MNAVLSGGIIAMCLLILIYLYRAIFGPSVFDRLIGLNGIASKAILLLVFIGLLDGRLDMYIDLAIGYSLLNLVGSFAVGKYLERRDMNS